CTCRSRTSMGIPSSASWSPARDPSPRPGSRTGRVKLVLFGATGMVGSGTLREALADPDVEAVLSVGRRSSDVRHAKLRELVLPDLFSLTTAEPELTGWDACIWALGISSVGMDEASYAKVT